LSLEIGLLRLRLKKQKYSNFFLTNPGIQGIRKLENQGMHFIRGLLGYGLLQPTRKQ